MSQLNTSTPTVAANPQAPVAAQSKPAVNAPVVPSTACCNPPAAAPKANRRQGRKQH